MLLTLAPIQCLMRIIAVFRYIIYASVYTNSKLSWFWFALFSEVRVEGLETIDYLDNLQNRERFTEQGDAITFEGEVSTLLVLTLCLASDFTSQNWFHLLIFLPIVILFLICLLFCGKGG